MNKVFAHELFTKNGEASRTLSAMGQEEPVIFEGGEVRGTGHITCLIEWNGVSVSNEQVGLRFPDFWLCLVSGNYLAGPIKQEDN